MSARNGLGPGITRRHARSCPALGSDDMDVCRCRPGYQAQAGPRKRRLTQTFPTLGAARAWKRDVEQAIARGQTIGGQPPRLRDAGDAWLDQAERGIVLARGDKPYRPSTLRGYRHAMRDELYPQLGDVRLDRITRGRLNAHVQGLQERGLAAQTIKNAIIPLRALYRHALDLELVSANPTTGLRVPAGSGRRMRFLAPAEIGPLLGALEDRDRVLWATAIYAGLRRGELMALRWADVDLAGGTITVSLSYDKGSGSTGPVKSAAGQDRRVPIIGPLRDLLVEHRQRAGGRGQGLVFARERLAGVCRRAAHGTPFSDQAVASRARERWARAKIAPVTLHDCRHTFASLMIAAMAREGTFNPKALQQMLGHASIVQTYDRYGHLFPGAERDAGRMLDSFLEAAASVPDGRAGSAGEGVAGVDSGALPSVAPDGGRADGCAASVQRSSIRRTQ